MQFKPAHQISVVDRTLDNIARGWHRISLLSRSGSLKLHAGLPDNDIKPLREQMQACLESRGGEVSARARAADLGQAYLELDDAGRHRFLRLIADEFGVESADLENAAKTYIADPKNAEALQDLQANVTPAWSKLFTQFNALPSGVKFLVDMRTDLVRYSRDDMDLVPLDRDLRNLLVSWFDVGFLDLRRLTWNEPAALLEKLIDYEAVHEIQSWGDLKNRLDVDRCCYAFFHPRMPEEPLIFVQVALVNGMSRYIANLLDDKAPVEDPESADTAIFYSISNTQPGLRGVSLGDFLIKRVVDDLKQRFPNLGTFATLSPIPRFRAYVERLVQSDDPDPLDASQAELIRDKVLGSDDWYHDENVTKLVEPVLSSLCAHYLVREKRGAGAADSVANFHLTNGARIEHINWLGDTSAQGMSRSLGLMVNYYYHLPKIEKNHEAYVGQGEITVSSAVRSLLKSL